MIYDDKKFIGSVIKHARIKSGMTQAALSEKISMTEKNYNSIENGRQFPAVNNFLKIIEVLNLSLEEFGVKLENGSSENDKIVLIQKILNSDAHACAKYLKAVNFADEITAV